MRPVWIAPGRQPAGPQSRRQEMADLTATPRISAAVLRIAVKIEGHETKDIPKSQWTLAANRQQESGRLELLNSSGSGGSICD